MSVSEVVCIKPYLVNKLITFLECLSIKVFSFVISCAVSVRIFISIAYFIFQLSIIINKFSTCYVEFRFRNNIFFWLELRFFWWTNSIVEFFISNFTNSRYKSFSSTIMRNSDCYIRFHCIVCNSCISSFDFFYCVLVNAFLAFLEFKFREFNVTSCIILNSFNNFTCCILQLECEFVSFKFTTFQTFSEVESDFNWNTVYTFFSWFVWFFNRFMSWIIVVNNLICCIFNIHTARNVCVHCCRNIKFIVASKGELSSVDNLSIFSIAK